MADDNEYPPYPEDQKPELPDDWREQKLTFDLELLTRNYLAAGGDGQAAAAILARTMSDVLAVAVAQQVQEEFADVLRWVVSSVQELKGDVPEEQVQEDDEEEPEDVPTDAVDPGEVIDKREVEDGQEREPVFGRRARRRE